ncbi:MAG: oxygen-independent coproporphyrinogen III oxidase [Deltaproteobacteria bacterium]|nr:oxygen-independent coproporphyrinogen III oxidase [Deltaproteobacteria bacterium]MCB9489335.1 oxygen-independent coproporphyrinogen III oxidase [Deltaproteobacteria bacterium]
MTRPTDQDLLDAARALPSPLDVPDALWTKYATSGPRYTSYPTAPQFTADFDLRACEAEYRASAERPDFSLYVHIPFCKRMCLFCGCHLFVAQDRSVGTPYVDRLLVEAKRLREMIGPRRVMQYAMGGGTPNYLLPHDMHRLIEGLTATFDFPDEGERSIEIDSRTVDTDYLDLLVDLGFNRFSFGVQDLDEDVIGLVRKKQESHRIAQFTDHLRKRGIESINFDLMYGLPAQTGERMDVTARRVIEMRPTRIAMFGYAHVPWMKPHQKVLEKYDLPEEKRRVEIWGTAFERFVEAGYVPIGMDHFAEPSDELTHSQQRGELHRNFMGYTTARGLDQAGLGCSSISAVGRVYAQNLKGVPEYHQAVDAGRPSWFRGLFLTDDDVIRREVILDLFCNFQLTTARHEAQFGIDFWGYFAAEREALAAFEPDGLVELSDDKIRVTPMGRFFIRNICMAFDVYLSGAEQRYSRTV